VIHGGVGGCGGKLKKNKNTCVLYGRGSECQCKKGRLVDSNKIRGLGSGKHLSLTKRITKEMYGGGEH